MVEWAQSANPDAYLIEPEVGDGEAIVFDGRAWHGSYNRQPVGTRSALILQFAAAECPVRIPDSKVLNWPFKFLDKPRPPAVLVHGVATGAANRLVPAPQPPPRTRLPAVTSVVRSFAEPLKENAETGWQHHGIFRGSTPAIDMMSCHAAVLSAGCSPHPPHAHNDEELLIVLDGEADLLIADRPEYEGARPVRAAAGDFAYYPAQQHHTIRNPGSTPVTYMMFRWNRHTPAPAQAQLPAKLFRAPPAPEPQQGRGFATRRFVEGPTHWLRKLHCHTTRLEVGAGYAEHADAYDVAILVRSGRVRTLGRDVGPGGFIYYPAGEIHGMQNVGDEPALYIVFEFHGAPVSVQNASASATPHSA